jgi:hypothetical protein
MNLTLKNNENTTTYVVKKEMVTNNSEYEEEENHMHEDENTNTEILEYFFNLEKDDQKKLVGFSLNDILVKIRMRDLLYISNYEFGVFEKEVKKAVKERKSFIQLVRSG